MEELAKRFRRRLREAQGLSVQLRLIPGGDDQLNEREIDRIYLVDIQADVIMLGKKRGKAGGKRLCTSECHVWRYYKSHHVMA